jgi:hypothetical protein
MPIESQVGSWYIVVTCEQCNSVLYLFRDLTEGKGSLSATYSVTCPHCYHRGEYEARHHRHAATV